MYKIRITPVVGNYEIIKGSFETKEQAWEWVEEHNDPLMDYDVIDEKGDPNENEHPGTQKF